MKRTTNKTEPADPKLPATVYVAWREYPNDSPTLSVEARAQDLATELGDDLRVGVYQLVGYVDVQNRTIASEVQPVKASRA